MKQLHNALHKVLQRPLPNDAQCNNCKFFDTSDPRVREILREHNPHTFSQILYQANCRCEDQFHAKKEEQRIMWSDSQLPNRHGDAIARTFSNFHLIDGTKKAYDSTYQFGMRKGPKILTLVGTYASGKSHLLEAVAREWLHDGHSVKYEYVPSMLNELRSASQKPESTDSSLWDLMQEKFKAKLLILDDLGQETPTDWTRKILTEIVDERIRTNGWLLTATNYTNQQLKERIDERFVSRLFDRSEAIVMTCKSYEKVA
tara:strand:+ start:1875 stop:2651 length:777 start_codon:yes stop_codon:yes gene_type:complete